MMMKLVAARGVKTSSCRSILATSQLRHLSNEQVMSETIVKSPFHAPSLSTDAVKMPLPKFVMKDFLNAENRDLVAMIDGITDKQLTFYDIYERSYRLASALRKLNLGPNDSVAIISPNTLHYSVAFLGTSLAGVRSTCMNPLCTEGEMAYMLEATNAKVIIAHPFNLKTAQQASKKTNGCQVFLFDDDASVDEVMSSYGDATRLSEFIQSADQLKDIDVDSFLPANQFDPHSVITLPFSSGTTGKMKGVMLTHNNLVSNILQIEPGEGKFLRSTSTRPRGSLLCPLPFFHIYGMVAGLFCCHNAGAKLVFKSAFDLPTFLGLVQKHKITRAFVVPPVVLALAKHPIVDKYDLSSLECLMSGAAPLGHDVQVACAERLNCIVKQAWGMTELSPCGTLTSDDHITDVKDLKGSSGHLAPATEAKIVCTVSGKDLHPSEEGEVLIRGPQVMKGYLDNEEATNATIREDGFMHTGDIGRFDEQGRLYITDRMKELIKYKGFQVPPAELEAMILTMPQVKDVIVIPVPDDVAGELPRAYVVPQDEFADAKSGFTPEAVVQYVHQRVAPHKRLRGGVIFAESVPKSPSGKLLRRVQIEQDRAAN